MNLKRTPKEFKNPFTPGAGHYPPFLAGRDKEIEEFEEFLNQKVILKNLILTGLRGVGKTVLLETFKQSAIQKGWYWVGTDMSQSTSTSERRITIRLLADLAVVTSAVVIGKTERQEREYIRSRMGFITRKIEDDQTLNFNLLFSIYENTPGLPSDKLKSVLEIAWHFISLEDRPGVVFAYDESQNLGDNPRRERYPLSLLLDVFQSIQRKSIPFMLVLAGLPTIFPKLVATRTYSERMFHVMTIDRLGKDDSKEAITVPTQQEGCLVTFNSESEDLVCETSGGYPYFIQFICKEVYDIWIQRYRTDKSVDKLPSVPIYEILRKLDDDFFLGRFSLATDRQREVLFLISKLSNCDQEFSVKEIEEMSRTTPKPFRSSQINQMLGSLIDKGLVYKNRHGKYSFAVPLLGQFLQRLSERQSERQAK